MLCATRTCNFLSLISQDGSAPAALASLLFDPPGPQFYTGKLSVSRLFYLFAHLDLLSSAFLISDLLLLLLLLIVLPFSSLTLPTSVFPSVNIVGSLTSKLPIMAFGIKQCYKVIQASTNAETLKPQHFFADDCKVQQMNVKSSAKICEPVNCIPACPCSFRKRRHVPSVPAAPRPLSSISCRMSGLSWSVQFRLCQ